MANKGFTYSVLVKLLDHASGPAGAISRAIGAIGKTAHGLLSGTGGIKGVLGNIGLGSLVTGGLFGGLVSAAKFAIGGVVSIFKAGFSAVVTIVKTAISIVTSIISTAFSLVKKALLITAGAAAAATASFILMTRATVRAGDELYTLSKRLGLSVEFLSEMQMVLANTGTDVGAVGAAVRALARNLEAASRGQKEAIALWEGLGVPIREANGHLRTAEELFGAVADALYKIENPMLRAGMAQRIFGRSALDLMPLIDSLTTSLAKQRAEARRLGATWTEEAAAAADRVGDAWEGLATAWKGLRNAFVQPFLGRIAVELEALASWVASNKEQVAAWGRTGAEWFGKVADAAERALGWIRSRDWSLENIQKGVAGLWDVLVKYKNTFADLFAFKAGNDWHIGGLIDLMIGAFQWAAVVIGDIFKVLWVNVGRDLTNALAHAAGDFGTRMQASALAVISKKAQMEWDATGYSDRYWAMQLTPNVVNRYKPSAVWHMAHWGWGALPPGVQEPLVGTYRKGHPIEDAIEEAMILAGKGLEGFGGLERPALTPAQKEAEVAAIRAESTVERDQALQRMVADLDFIAEAVRQPGAEALAAVGEMAPPKPAPDALFPALQTPQAQRIIDQIKRSERMEALYTANNMLGQAREEQQHQAALTQELNGLMNNILGIMQWNQQAIRGLQQDVANMGKSVSRMATAR